MASVLTGTALLHQIQSLPAAGRDAWVDAMLGLDDAMVEDAPLPHGAVPYLPCGIDDIVAAVVEVPVRADDELVDLGSGLGRVVMLAHLLSGARACGIEIQDHLVARARARSQAMQLDRVSFVHASAEDAALDGSVFFMYAPFNGAMLERVLDNLHTVARRRRIIVCAVHLSLDHVPWLVARASSSLALAIYDSRGADSIFAR